MKHKMKIFAATCLMAIAAIPSALAAPVTLDFEGFAAGQVIDDEYASMGVTVSTQSNGIHDLSVIYNSRVLEAGADDTDLVGPFDDKDTVGNDGYEPGNILIIAEGAGAERAAGAITCTAVSCDIQDDEALGGDIIFNFHYDVAVLGIDIFDINEFSIDEPPVELHFFNEIGVLISTLALDRTGDNNTFKTIDIAGVTGVRRIVVDLFGSGAIDNLRFEAMEAPIPGAIPLMLTGLAAGGISLRKKKKAA